MTARFAALLGVLLVLACCAAPGSAAPQSFIEGSTLHTINFGGLDRSYRLYIPAGLASPAPLVVMMHGGFGSAEQAERAYGWDELADSAKFVVGLSRRCRQGLERQRRVLRQAGAGEQRSHDVRMVPTRTTQVDG